MKRSAKALPSGRTRQSRRICRNGTRFRSPKHEKPDLVLTGTVDRSDYQRNVPVSFDVPGGITRIGGEYEYTRLDGKP